MDGFRIPVGQWADSALNLITVSLRPFFDVVRSIFLGIYDTVEAAFIEPPILVIIAIIVVLAFVVRGWKFALGTALGLGLIVGVNQWDAAMETLALVLVASIIAIVISVPLGVLGARNQTASNILKPTLDFLQTMPAFVYLVPALLLFRVGVVPGIVATIIFAMAPGVRFTELGIRGVDREVVEAGQAFGASPWRILRQIQLPLAMPTIMAGINQVIMLSLSMVVVAGLVGAGGLGSQIVRALASIDVGLGVEAGIAVVIIAIILDRLTASIGAGVAGGAKRRPFGWLFSRRQATTLPATPAAASDAAGPKTSTAIPTTKEKEEAHA
jgi:glycine betaine/proline transport system substrate-binding protein